MRLSAFIGSMDWLNVAAYLAVLLLVADVTSADDSRNPANVNRRHLLELQRASLRHRESERLRYTTCTNSETLPQEHVSSNHAAVARAKRSIAHDDVTPNAGSDDQSVLFGANAGVIEWRVDAQQVRYPASNFSVEAWLKPHGGQAKEVSILGQ